MPTSPESLISGDADSWHKGNRTISVSFIDQVPSYYLTVDTNRDGVADSYLIAGNQQGPVADAGGADAGDEDQSYTIPIGARVAMSDTEKALMRTAIDEWNAVATINAVVTEAGAGADITLGAYDFGNKLYGFVTEIGGTLGVPSPYGDLWLDLGNPDQRDPQYGSTGWETYLHEFGHALGLEHPDDDPYNKAGDPRNNQKYTLMSYDMHPSWKALGLSEAAADWAITPMQYDIAAVQKLYGANLTTRADDTRYLAPGSAYALQDGGRLENGRTAILTIWDAGGIDTLDASGQTGAVRLDLNPGAFSTVGQYADNIAMSLAHEENGVIVNLIENATGGSGDDMLTGNVADNILLGRDGNDSVSGGDGNDFGSGGWGSDTVRGEAGNDLLFGDDDNDVVDGGTGDDVIYGGTGDDTVLGGMGDDQVRGEAGKDFVSGGEGHDFVDGGEGDDLVKGGTGNDTLFGSQGNDSVYGDEGDDFLGAGSGNDTASGGFGNDEVHGEDGGDQLFGGDGNDGVYGEAGDDIVLGGSGNDYLTGDAGFDRIRGEDGDDRLFGGDDGDDLSGGAGDDVLEGGLGADLLFGNAGADILSGGAGVDVFAFGMGDGLDRILDLMLGGPEADVIAFNGGAFADFTAVQAASRQEGADVVIAYGAGDALTLQNVQLVSLSAASFSFV